MLWVSISKIICFYVAGLLWAAGGVAYVIPQSKYISNPLSYVFEIFRAVGMFGLFQSSFQPNGGVPPGYPDTGSIGYTFDINDYELSGIYSNDSVSPVYPDTGLIGYPMDNTDDLTGVNSNFPPAGGNFDPSSFNSNIHNSNLPISNGNTGGISSESFGNADFSNYNNTNMVYTVLEIISKLLRPEFGYSFYLAWVAFALGLLATVLAGIGFNSILKEKKNGQIPSEKV